MQHNGIRGGLGQQLGVDLERAEGPTRSSPSFSWPIEVQVSVTSTSAPGPRRPGRR